MKTMSYEDDFEMLTLRHEYLKKIKNPESVDIRPWKHLATITAEIIYEKCRANFEKVGFDLCDVESIACVYLYAYLGVYSFEVNPASKERYMKSFFERNSRDPSLKEMDRAEKNMIINFLRQKLHHCSKVCERKSRNIVGARSKKYTFAYTELSKPAHPSDITKDYKKYGYRKVTSKELLEAKANAKKSGSRDLFDSKGFKIVEINDYSANMYSFGDIEDSDGNSAGWEEFIKKEEVVGFYSEETPEYLSNPEETLIKKQDDVAMDKDVNNFNNLESKNKKTMLKRFVNANKRNSRLTKEVKTARLLLKK